MAKIFISYRREDSSAYAGRLFDHLQARFGRNQVFMDVDTISPGMDFVEAIEQAVGECDVLIAVIGPQWLSITDAEGHRRLDNPEDFIRLEIATAINRRIHVIPVLVHGAAMPSARELPAELSTLTRRNALELSNTRWDYDVGRLIETIEKQVGGPIPIPSDSYTDSKRGLLSLWAKSPGSAKALSGLAVLVVGVVILFTLNGTWTPDDPGNRLTAGGGPEPPASSPIPEANSVPGFSPSGSPTPIATPTPTPHPTATLD
jgi:hypothetical protein